MEQSKTCTKCRQIKPLNEYSPNKKGKYGLQAQCKLCRSADSSSYRKQNQADINARRRKAYADAPELHRQKSRAFRSEFPEKHRASVKKSTAKNLQRKNLASKQWRLNNPEAVKTNWLTWSKSNPDKLRQKKRTRRARLKGVISERYTEKDLIAVYGTNCYLCLSPIDFDAPRWTAMPGWELGLHIDHVIPIRNGGADTLQNVRPSHGKCNLIKH